MTEKQCACPACTGWPYLVEAGKHAKQAADFLEKADQEGERLAVERACGNTCNHDGAGLDDTHVETLFNLMTAAMPIARTASQSAKQINDSEYRHALALIVLQEGL